MTAKECKPDFEKSELIDTFSTLDDAVEWVKQVEGKE